MLVSEPAKLRSEVTARVQEGRELLGSGRASQGPSGSLRPGRPWLGKGSGLEVGVPAAGGAAPSS